MVYIEPLEFQTWFVSVFAGSQDIFLALALFFIFGLSAFFRMSLLVMFFMLVIFLVMFNSFVSSYFLLIIGLIGGLLLGYWANSLWKR